MTKPEFPPLFPPGFHTISIDEINQICVTNFPRNDKRKELFDNFLKFLKHLEMVNSKFEIWVDGSFTTEKEEPEDIDILIIYDELHLKTLAPGEINIINSLFNRSLSKIRFNLDVLLCEKNDINQRSYWRGWFGFSRSEQLKGIAKFEYGY
ncbi:MULTISPECIES: DUF6932 family protein [Chryseobacterium]|uniref:Polymerase nucleotidyl transferase domain-containing protein n=1 Tax=Chryseobacterium indoltheticum TaxID=254 RepID=A0A381FG80_9FLAO|nr:MULTISPECIES: hypothetical protein [Chryseobacterium]MDQ8141821.1 hypothetical protein [Chryseobacterium sp. CFS15]SUX45162.1 Uncharacterised protein [Chryseobacterium indoltheticum]